jgi:hypothetical protein
MTIAEIIACGGGEFRGMQPVPDHGPMVLFNDPKTGTTIGIWAGAVTVESVREHIAESRRRYEASGQLIAQPGGTP